MFMITFIFKCKYSKWNFWLEIRVTSQTPHFPASSPFPPAFLTYPSPWSPSTAVWTQCWFEEAPKKRSRPEKVVFGMQTPGGPWITSKAGFSSLQTANLFFPLSLQRPTPSTFSPHYTYRFCKNCIPCHAWKVPFWICMMRFPRRFLEEKKIAEINLFCPTGSWSGAVLICRKYANPR